VPLAVRSSAAGPRDCDRARLARKLELGTIDAVVPRHLALLGEHTVVVGAP
jgi:hypothetical protein